MIARARARKETYSLGGRRLSWVFQASLQFVPDLLFYTGVKNCIMFLEELTDIMWIMSY
jgi:hypothetical protein